MFVDFSQNVVGLCNPSSSPEIGSYCIVDTYNMKVKNVTNRQGQACIRSFVPRAWFKYEV